ncbi:hypothetical protein D8S78_05580 [Natrialba swarupiae]|nr:hypothetical protein [Natrialba swarupiae]
MDRSNAFRRELLALGSGGLVTIAGCPSNAGSGRDRRRNGDRRAGILPRRGSSIRRTERSGAAPVDGIALDCSTG